MTTKRTNGHAETRSKQTLHLRPSQKTLVLIRKQAKEMDRSIHAHACMLLRKAAAIYEKTSRPEFLDQ